MRVLDLGSGEMRCTVSRVSGVFGGSLLGRVLELGRRRATKSCIEAQMRHAAAGRARILPRSCVVRACVRLCVLPGPVRMALIPPGAADAAGC